MTSSVLRKTNATVITNEECHEAYASDITDGMLCTGASNHQGTCNVYKLKSHSYLIIFIFLKIILIISGR
jgi:hypothetical protein